MLKNGYIDEETANNVKKSEIKLNITEINENNAQYIAAATEEISASTQTITDIVEHVKDSLQALVDNNQTE